MKSWRVLANKDPIVLGIDPGSAITGYGVITQTGSRLLHVQSGVIKAPARGPLETRLLSIFNQLEEIIDQTSPTAMAVETLFFAKNVRSVISLAHARGIALLLAAQNSLPVSEYSPAVVKRAVVGFGNATKDQVQEMIGRLFQIPKEQVTKLHDQTDALAVALCHLNSTRTQLTIARSEFKGATPRSRTHLETVK